MKTLIQNARILTMDSSNTVYERGNLLVEDGQIVYVGPESVQGPVDRVLDGENRIAMPGMINCHHHLAMNLLRGEGSDLPLMQWLTEAIWPKEDHLTSEAVYWASVLGIAEMVSMGVTCFNDMYFFEEETARACVEAGMRAFLTRGLMDSVGSGSERLEGNVSLYREWNGAGNDLIRVGLGPHAEYTCSEEYLKQCRDAAQKLGCPVHIHVSETKSEVEGCVERHGASPVQFLNRIGMFDGPAVAAHCVWVDEADLAVLRERNVAVSHNPTSNLKLGSGIAPVERMRQLGITVGLGTDGVASNNNMDIWEEMCLAALLQKGSMLDPAAMPVEDVLRMATIQGAKSLAWQDRIGSLEAGKRADLVLVRADTPVMTPATHWQDNLVYAAKSSDVCLTMIDGRVVYENGTWPTLDVERAMARAAEEAAKL